MRVVQVAYWCSSSLNLCCSFRSHSGVCDAVLCLLSGGHIAAPHIAQYCNPFFLYLFFAGKKVVHFGWMSRWSLTLCHFRLYCAVQHEFLCLGCSGTVYTCMAV
ncbi:hypothetical protein VPH35_045935 [Triticum aestivum]